MKLYQFYFISSMLILCLNSCTSSSNIENTSSNPISNHSDDTSKVDLEENENMNNVYLENPESPRNYLINFKEGNSIDVRVTNPYAGLDLPIVYMSNDSLDFTYALYRSTQANSPDFGDISSILKHSCNNESSSPVFSKFPIQVFSKSPVIDVKGDRIVVGYHISFQCSEEEVIITQGVSIIYNEYGKEIKRLKDQEAGFYDLRLSNNGKFLMQKYGFNYGEDGGEKIDSGFKFYDLENKKKIGELGFKNDQFTISYDTDNNNIGFHIIRAKPDFWEWYFIDVLAKVYYLKKWDRLEYSANQFDKDSEKIDWSKVALDEAYQVLNKIQKLSL